MKKIGVAVLAICLMICFAACASKHAKQVDKDLKEPINCATAEGDIRTLEHEKAHVAQQIAAGVETIAPIGLVAGLVTGTEGKKAKVATGEYDKLIDKKIAQIKEQCGLR